MYAMYRERAFLGRTCLAVSFAVFLFLLVPLPAHGYPQQSYVGAQACAKCHAEIHNKWADSLHSKIMQPATDQTVEGDFAQGKIVLRGSVYLLRHQNGKYFITESDSTGKPLEHQVEYTLGSRRIQQYLTVLSDGRIIVLPPSWDIPRKMWVRDIDIDNPEEDASVSIQTWNKTCYSCHVSQEQKNFDLQQDRYHTTWQDFGVGCERCHGPGSEHVALANGTKVLNAKTRAAIDHAIVNPSRLDPGRSTMICAQCHSFRDIYVDGFKAGANYYDYFLPIMEYRLPSTDDPAYWPDGRPRWLSNEATALWQSECYLKGGATCVTCHSEAHAIDVVRNPQLRLDDNALCAPCHASIVANVSAHTHHAAESAGSSCIACHMPATVIGLDGWIRDHSMSIPAPENTIQHGIPNACNLCHKDKSAEWASEQVNHWYGDQSKQPLLIRADAFAKARSGDPVAIPALLQILSEPSAGPFIRANAAGYLANFPEDPSAYNAVLHAFSDPEPLVRAIAASAIRPRAAQREALAPKLVSLLRDPAAIVRMSAAIALVSLGVQKVPDEYAEQFAQAKELYRLRAELDSDDAQQQFAAGRFYFLSGDMDSAMASFRASLKLDHSIPAQYDLALALATKGDVASARQLLKTIQPNDPQYASAQKLLASFDLQSAQQNLPPPSSAAKQASDEAQAAFSDGQVLYQDGNFGGALKELEHALLMAPQAGWATKARIYRAVCLEKMARTEEAEAAIRALSDVPAAQTDLDLQLAYVELLYETGRTEEALKQIDSLIAAVPKAPLAYFWRARVLLQLHRTSEAASAAEESIRLSPGLAATHNLLMRIYQMQGRTKEAAEQAKWLRNYERQKE
jgi:predicted CXXCH cytochrome family protein